MDIKEWQRQQARQAAEKKAAYGNDIDFSQFSDPDTVHPELDDLSQLDSAQQKNLESIGLNPDGAGRAGTYMQLDHSVVHCNVSTAGLELMNIDQALKQHAWLGDYFGQAVTPDSDKYTARATLHQEHGYFIRALPGVKIEYPVQACLYIGQEDVVQDVHNVIIVEENAELNIITGCATDPGVKRGLHIGISEFFIKKGGKLTFTMIHNWSEDVAVRPRTVSIIEEGGLFMSNYICMKPVKDLQMYPTAKLVGPGAVARLNSILVAPPGSHMDVGGRAVLAAPDTKAEIIARSISTGGTIINRGHLLGEAPASRAHLECHGLLLKPPGVIHAIPELEARTDNAELSHEAAVGKIAPEEIEYLMARGLSEEEATATIVRGFLNINIEGLPASLSQQINRTINEFSLTKSC